MADPVADFYAGKTITLIISAGPGGGYDTNARLVARHLGKHKWGPSDAGFPELRKAFAQIMADPEFLADAKKINLGIRLLGHAELTAAAMAILPTPPDLVEKVRRANRADGP